MCHFGCLWGVLGLSLGLISHGCPFEAHLSLVCPLWFLGLKCKFHTPSLCWMIFFNFSEFELELLGSTNKEPWYRK